MNKITYKDIVKHYESCLDKYGDSHLGVDWPNFEDLLKRYQVMIDIAKQQNDDKKAVSMLDFGCGTAMLKSFIDTNGLSHLTYYGLDLSEKFINVASSKFPDSKFYCGDILEDNLHLPRFDYVVMNGVFTERRELSEQEMWQYFELLIERVFNLTNIGIAFNLMSKNVDWERDDLFHVSLDKLTDFLTNKISRNFIIRNDYGLYEFTTYIFK